MLHVELPVWSGAVGKDPALTEFMRAEGERIQRTYGNHPSFTMMCLVTNSAATSPPWTNLWMS